MTGFEPKPEHKFTFGLWAVGNRGRDPFGDATRPTLPYERLDQLTIDILLGVR